MAKRTIDSVDVTGKRVLMRVDFNVPLDGAGRITDDRRIRMALPSIESVIERGGKLILMSHLGRPGGTGPEPAFSLRPAAERLAELLAPTIVRFPGADCIDAPSVAAIESMQNGQVVVLENLRFSPGEKTGDAAFAGKLAEQADVYCNDAFGTAHRADASMVAVPEAMLDRPRVAGLLLQRELRYLADLLEDPERPFVAVLGGAKVSDKLGAIRHLLGRVDAILVGGAMAYTFLQAKGLQIGSSLVEPAMLEEAAKVLAEPGGASILLPTDHRCGQAIEPATPVEVLGPGIESGWMGLDIGPQTETVYGDRVRGARTIVWNGPMGVFECPPFDTGTRAVAEAITRATAAGAQSVVGGGDSAAAVEAFGMEDGFSHISTGGGASLRMLEGGDFASVDALEDAAA